MTNKRTPGEGKADVVVTFGSIPGATESAAVTTNSGEEGRTSAGSDYERVRGLLTESSKQSGADTRSEKMTEEMESFDQRWQQRPVSPLVKAGKKMADTPGNTGLNRLLGLAAPSTDSDVEPKPAEYDDDHADESEISELRIAEAPFTPPPDAAAAEPRGSKEFESEGFDQTPDEDLVTIAPTTRIVVAQEAYAALSPLEAEIFLNQAGLVDSGQARIASTRAQEMALDAMRSYERETTGLQQQLVAMEERADRAKEEAAALTTQVAALQGQLELAAAELVAARRAATDDDGSEGGAGRELIKDRDDLRPPDVVDTAADIAHTDDPVNEENSDSLSEPEPSVVADVSVETNDERRDGSSDDRGGSDLTQALQRLIQDSDRPTTPQPNFGE